MALFGPFDLNIAPNRHKKCKNWKSWLKICLQLSKTFIVLEYEVCNFKTQNLALFGLCGPNIGPNWGLYSKKCKFWLKTYQWLSKSFVLSEYGLCSSKIKEFAFRTYFGPIRSNISEECPVDIYFFGPMAWFYPNKFKTGLGLPGIVFLIFDLG